MWVGLVGGLRRLVPACGDRQRDDPGVHESTVVRYSPTSDRMIKLKWLAERSGTVLLWRAGVGFFLLDLETKAKPGSSGKNRTEMWWRAARTRSTCRTCLHPRG